MEYPLRFGRQTWKPRNDGELTLFLPAHERYGMSFQMDFDFVPPWLGDEDFESEHRTMCVMVHGYFPRLTRWHELAGFELETRDVGEVLGEEVTPRMEGPEIEIWSSGKGPASIHTHANHGWETRLKMGEITGDGAYTFLCELEAFFPSDRAREVSLELCVKEFFGELDFDDDEKAKLLEEGWRFSYLGRVCLNQLSCIAPLNTNDPIGWARQLAEREVGMKRFGLCRVNGGKMDGSFKPEDGIVTDGRLVLLSPPSVWFAEWQERQQREKRDEGQTGK